MVPARPFPHDRSGRLALLPKVNLILMRWLGTIIGGEGTNRTYPGPRCEPTTVLKTARATRHPSLSNSQLGPDGLEDSAGLRKLARLQFRVNLFPIDADLKSAAPRRHEPQRTDALLEAQKFFRQTDGLGFVISSRAIFDCDFGSHDQCFALCGAKFMKLGSASQVGVVSGNRIATGSRLKQSLIP